MMGIVPLCAESTMPSIQQLAILAAILIATFTVLTMRRRRRPLDGSPKQYRREIDGATAQSTAVKRDLEQLLVELEQLSKNINAQIETKFAKLERSIADADKRIVALRTLLDEAGKRTSSESPAQPGDKQTAGNASAPTTTPLTPDERHRGIYELADRGLTPLQIARELGRKVGEVELILNLRDNTGASGTPPGT